MTNASNQSINTKAIQLRKKMWNNGKFVTWQHNTVFYFARVVVSNVSNVVYSNSNVVDSKAEVVDSRLHRKLTI